MILTLTLVASLLLGYELSLRLWRGELASCERATYAIAIGTLLWLASAWALALTSLLRREMVIARTLLLLAIAIALLVRRRNELRARFDMEIDPRTATIFLLALAPLVLFVVFSLWRGALLPPLNHDALAYHLPKAVLYMRAHGFRTFEDLSFIIAPRASNYELLIADAITGDGSDRFTEWPSVIFYVGFIAVGVALAQRWWRIGAAPAIALALLLGGVPVLLLHASAHKNDLIFAFLAVTAFVAAGRALSDDDTAALALTVACFGAISGTKTHGVVLALAFAPLVAMRLFRTRRRLAIVAAVALLSIVLLGGADQLVKLSRHSADRAAVADRVGVPPYGDWQNLWQGPYLLLAAPFASDSQALSVPWDPRPWFWRRYELFFSEFGVVFSLAALAMPVLMFVTRKRPGFERYAITFAVLAAFALLLPVHYRPLGLYLIYLPRFVLFLVPVVFAWLAPLLERIGKEALLAIAAIVFSIYAIQNVVNDAFAPIDYVRWATEHRGTRSPAFDGRRVELVVDRMAGPRDVVLIDAGSGAWIYPAYGAKFQRDVRFIPPGTGPVTIPDDVDWVVIDRAYSAVWGNPDFKNLGQAGQYLARAKPSAEDSRVIKAVSVDARFAAERVQPASMQAIFRRVQPRAAR